MALRRALQGWGLWFLNPARTHNFYLQDWILVSSLAGCYWWGLSGVVPHSHLNTMGWQGDICQYIIYINNIPLLIEHIQMYCTDCTDCTLHIHHDSRHLLTTVHNLITSPDVSSPSPIESYWVPISHISITFWGLYLIRNTSPRCILLPLRQSSNGLHICYET